jgi:hypothetical protein
MVTTHGKGPKDVFVKAYRRWKAGKREWVRYARRSSWHPDSLRDSPDQLDFGF